MSGGVENGTQRRELRRRGAESRPQVAGANPRIEITPSVAQYEQLCRDLKKLRKSGAISHTAAIIEAVHAAAQGHMVGGDR